MNRWIQYAVTIYSLLARDMCVFKVSFKDKFLDTCIMLFSTVIIFSYFLPSYGLQTGYGPFVLIGIIAGFGFFDILGKVATMIADLEHDKTILYMLSLPLPSWLVFFYIGFSWAFYSAIISSLLFPMGKLLLFSQFDLTKVSCVRFLLIFVMSNMFFGFFALWLSSIFKQVSSISHLFVRVINPMYMFGGYMYSWYAVYALSPTGAYINLINPLIYVMEGMRSAVLGPDEYLPFWISLNTLFLFTVFFAWHAIYRLKKRLDVV